MMKSFALAGIAAAVMGISQIGVAVAQEQYNPAAEYIARLSGSYVPEQAATTLSSKPIQDRFEALVGNHESVHPVRPYFGRD